MTRCAKLILYTLCATPRIYHFSNKPLILLVRNCVLKPYLVLRMLLATGSAFVSGPFQRTDLGKMHVCRNIHTCICFASALSPLCNTVCCLHGFLALHSTGKYIFNVHHQHYDSVALVILIVQSSFLRKGS